MPELPEVETLRQAIEPCIVGRKIVDTAVLKQKIIARPQAETFCSALAGCTITAMGRRGKFLTLQMDSGDTVILHLRMTGNLLAAPADWPQEKHTHVVFSLSDGTQLRYVDSRGFGRFWLQTAGEQDDFSGMAKLGPEPFDPTFTAGYLQKSQQSRRRPIKECLLDQSVVAGIGNIYADEILFAAGICPTSPASTLRPKDWRAIAALTPQILQQGISYKRRTARQHLEGTGKKYSEETFLQAYGRAGQPCTRCGTPIERTVIGGRSSCYCPHCQPVPGRPEK